MRIREDLVLRHIGKDHVIVDPEQEMVDMSKVFTLNDSAAWLWEELIGKEFNGDMLIRMLREQHELSYNQAEEDANRLIETFEKNGLLEK